MQIIRLGPSVFLLTLASYAVIAEPPTSRPNVLLLVVDGLPMSPLPPAMLAVAQRARVFERAYLPHPFSGPTRAAIFSGHRPEQQDVWGEPSLWPRSWTSLADSFTAGGYQTARVGRAVGGAVDGTTAWGRALTPSAGKDTAAHVVALLEELREGPLFVVAGFDDLGAAATPAPSPFPPSSPQTGPEYPEIALSDLSFHSRPGRRRRLGSLSSEERQQALLRQQERTRRFGEQLARVVAALDRRKLWESTVVGLVGTEAVGMSEAALPRPDVLFEERLRVPLLLAAPRLPSAGQPTRALVELSDLYPTLLELAGLPPVPGVDGRTLTAILRDPLAAGRTVVASVTRREAGRIGRTLRTTKWRYTEWPDGSQELYDHEADPHEHTNVVTRPEANAAVNEMRGLLAARERELRSPTPSEKPPSAAADQSSTRRRPNVLLVIFDDLNVHLGTYGFPARTPHFDRLARMGRRFERAYAQLPSCSPSRTSLLSGWRPELANVWQNIDAPRKPGMVPVNEHFGAHGYFTASIGKVWEGIFASQFRWDVIEHVPMGDSEAAPPPPGPLVRPWMQNQNWWRATHTGDEQEPDNLRARRVVQLIEQKRDRPFFIALGFAKPHLKWIAPLRYFELYDPAKIDFVVAPENDLEDIPAISVKNQQLSRPGLVLSGRAPAGFNPDPDLRRKAIAAYYAAVSFADAQLGVVLEALERNHLLESTIIVVTGDHGYHLGEHRGMWRKDTLFEEALRVPLIISGPGVRKPGLASAPPVELLDVYPTLVDLAGLSPVAGLGGKSLVPLLREPGAPVPSNALSFRAVPSPTVAASLRTERWRYTQWPDGSEELYDVETDPRQQTNLAGVSKHAATLAELRASRVTLVP